MSRGTHILGSEKGRAWLRTSEHLHSTTSLLTAESKTLNSQMNSLARGEFQLSVVAQRGSARGRRALSCHPECGVRLQEMDSGRVYLVLSGAHSVCLSS